MKEQRRKISRYFAKKHGLPNAVGVVDGTPVIYYQKPGIDGEVFWTRKSHYAQNLQLICDHKGKIRYYLIGWPGTL